MKTFLATFFVLLSFNLYASEIKISVKGMVCSMCAQGISKKFKALPEVESLNVDLTKKIVVVKTNGQKDIGDDKIKSIISESGFLTVSIERTK